MLKEGKKKKKITLKFWSLGMYEIKPNKIKSVGKYKSVFFDWYCGLTNTVCSEKCHMKILGRGIGDQIHSTFLLVYYYSDIAIFKGCNHSLWIWNYWHQHLITFSNQKSGHYPALVFSSHFHYYINFHSFFILPPKYKSHFCILLHSHSHS